MKNSICFMIVSLVMLLGCSKDTLRDELTDELIPPKVSLIKVENITSSGVSVESQVVELGNKWGNVSYGVCWSASPNPTISDSKTSYGSTGKTTGFNFTDELTGLIPETTYYVRTYVSYGSGTVYSNLLSFTTNASVVKPISLTAKVFPLSLSCTGVIVAFDMFNMPNEGYNSLVNKGVCWGTTINPTTQDNIGYNEKYDMVIDNILYHYNSWIVGLQPSTQYHARPFFVTGEGSFYGEDISFSTNPVPVVITVGVTDITSTSAVVIGNVTSTGGSFVVERGICWDNIPSREKVRNELGFGLVSHFIEQEVQSVNGSGEFRITITNLKPGTKYYVFTFVGVMTGLDYGDQVVEYGEEVEFTTK
jgi:hypothetical protein